MHEREEMQSQVTDPEEGILSFSVCFNVNLYDLGQDLS